MEKKNILLDLSALKPGLHKTLQKTIQQSNMLSFGHGALTELIEASVSAVDPLLPEGYVTIGLSTYVNCPQETW